LITVAATLLVVPLFFCLFAVFVVAHTITRTPGLLIAVVLIFAVGVSGTVFFAVVTVVVVLVLPEVAVEFSRHIALAQASINYNVSATATALTSPTTRAILLIIVAVLLALFVWSVAFTRIISRAH
jgi:hypothetical protein